MCRRLEGIRALSVSVLTQSQRRIPQCAYKRVYLPKILVHVVPVDTISLPA